LEILKALVFPFEKVRASLTQYRFFGFEFLFTYHTLHPVHPINLKGAICKEGISEKRALKGLLGRKQLVSRYNHYTTK
jgi:hypothetical protein